MSRKPNLNPNEFGILNQRGFLPAPSPIKNSMEAHNELRVATPGARAALDWIDELVLNLPKLIMAGKARTMIKKALDQILFYNMDYHLQNLILNVQSHNILAYLMRSFSFLGHALVWEDPENPMDHIHAGLAVPWHAVAQRLGRPPVLSYASYALDNWRMIEEGSIEIGNIAILQNFLGGIDEDWFILVHVEIEAEAGTIPRSIAQALKCIARKDAIGLYANLCDIAKAEKQMYETLLRMPEHCDPHLYYTRVRPWIHGWINPALPNGMVYEGVEEYEGKPQKFRGETGAQSSIIPLLDAFLEIEHADNKLTSYLLEMRDYMPPKHRKFIEEVERLVREGLSVKKFIRDDALLSHSLQSCYHWLELFRNKHLEYAATYIQRQSQQSKSNPSEVGTGGTPFMPYLKEHLEDTKKARKEDPKV
ncbi:MAG: hypothetical protein Q8R29_00860 [bacterium]|nr:hypothetical protein [bacterium]